MRGSDERTTPNRSSPADHWRRASETSSRLRATKFHHIKRGSGNGIPPSSRARARGADVEPALLPSLAQVGQQARLGQLVPDGDGALEDDQGVLALAPQRENRARWLEEEVGTHVIRVAPSR